MCLSMGALPVIGVQRWESHWGACMCCCCSTCQRLNGDASIGPTNCCCTCTCAGIGGPLQLLLLSRVGLLQRNGCMMVMWLVVSWGVCRLPRPLLGRGLG
jgi:hypothetical protein